MQNPRTISPPPGNTAVATERQGVPPFGKLLFGLFFQPQIVANLAAQKIAPGKAFRFLTLACLVCGVGLGLAKVPRALVVTQDWAEWFAQEMETVWVEDGRLHWAKPANLPYTTRHRGIRVDFVPTGTEFAVDDLTGPEKQGFWIEPENVQVWWRHPQEKTVVMPLVEKGKVGGVVKLERLWPDGLKLQGERVRRDTRQMVFNSLPLLCLREVLSVFLCVIMYAVTFSLVTFVLRSPLTMNGFPSVLGFHLLASVPPLVVATVYAALDFPFLDLSTAFVGSFVVYLFVIFAKAKPPGEKTDDRGGSSDDLW